MKIQVLVVNGRHDTWVEVFKQKDDVETRIQELLNEYSADYETTFLDVMHLADETDNYISCYEVDLID